ncbi:MAG: argininosuccinate lyase [Pseudomonadota bacterium]
MTDRLWQKEGLAGADDEVQTFLAGEDVLLDRHLIVFDIRATVAHVNGLGQIGIVDPDEQGALVSGLEALAAEVEQGTFVLGPPHEDGHSAIEAYLTERLGPLGGKVHTGRSRNDQVQTALRLYLRDRLDQLAAVLLDIAGALLSRARQDEMTVMPGYTHLQRAMPSTVGLWLGGLAEAFTDIAELAQLTRRWMNSSPLGTAAGYGVNLPLARDAVAEELNFDRLQLNPQYVQNSRGRFELQAVTALAQATLELRRLAWDLSLYVSEEFQFLSLPQRYVTGSSIMPNKANPDTVELLRARHAVVAGALAELQAALSLPSGYQRDLQVTKPPVIRAFESVLPALRLVPELVTDMTLHRDRMAAAIDSAMFATDIAVDAAREGIPFRDAYRSAMGEDASARSAEDSVRTRVSPGACADLRLDELSARWKKLRAAAGPAR